MISRQRRRIVFSAAAVAIMSLLDVPAFAQSDSGSGRFVYRGFTVDTSAAQNAPNFKAVEGSLKHQIDIVADCGVSPAILGFFKVRKLC